MKITDIKRRSFLKAGIAASTLFAPLPYTWVWAQSEGTVKLLRAPKIALVIGNNKYKEAPLKNPVNDARAIGESLKHSGFEVTVRLDAGKNDLTAAVKAYTQALAAKKAVGLFYYAGHGIQLAWRNYMLPVDADIDTIADIQKQGVEVSTLLSGTGSAANPMNIVILDACRDNPFGSLKGVDHRGLSQMDAPHNTLLAYATSPGNTASDGDGSNGLYTENLLKEFKVPEAKVEDVFKRVRLAVRRRTNGQQVPWESTSLEEDFWFIPPKEFKKSSEAEEERRFDEELAIWEKAKEAPDTAPLEDYLRRYPSGRFCELAQLRLDFLLARRGEKRVEVTPQTGNPFTQGLMRADVNYKVGDFYSYRVIDMTTKAQLRQFKGEVTYVSGNEITFDGGQIIIDRMGNTQRSSDGYRYTDNQNMPLEFSVGHRWVTRYRVYPPNVPPYIRITNETEYRIVGKETVTVPAGTFDCFRIEGRGIARGPMGDTTVIQTFWYAPDRARSFIARELIRKPFPGAPNPSLSERFELTAYKQT